MPLATVLLSSDPLGKSSRTVFCLLNHGHSVFLRHGNPWFRPEQVVSWPVTMSPIIQGITNNKTESSLQIIYNEVESAYLEFTAVDVAYSDAVLNGECRLGPHHPWQQSLLIAELAKDTAYF